MAKTIKFNLILNGHPVRDLEGLQDNFSIEDILEYYRNGMLEQWLEVRGYKEQFEKVKKIDLNGNINDIIKELIDIFKIPF